MTTLHLTDAQRDTFAACGLIVIEGERAETTADRVVNRDRSDNLAMAEHHQSPLAMLVAPEGWRILTDGRVVTLTATCPDCKGRTWDEPHRRDTPILECDHIYCPLHGDVGGDRFHGRCQTCKMPPYDGKVTLGRFTIPALLPVVDGPLIGRSHIRLHPDGAALWLWADDTWKVNPLNLDPLPQSGAFVAIPEALA
jgi:hypothetical protein